jgi:hypothetical protein
MKTKHAPFIILLAGISAFIIARAGVWPVDLGDEFIYFDNGSRGVFPGQWSPLYTALYSTLHFLISSPVATYRTVHGLVYFANILVIFLVLRASGMEKLIALLISSLLLCWIPWSTAPTLTYHFDLILILLFFLLMQREPFKKQQNLWMAVGFLYLCYSRPDNLICAIIYFGLGSFDFFQQKGKIFRRPDGWIPALLCVLAIGLFQYNSPFNNDRSWTSFRDHYYYHLSEKTVSQHEILQNTFGGANSILSAMFANFEAFAIYTGGNLLNFISGSFLLDAALFEPCLLLSLVAGLIFLFLRTKKDKKKHSSNSCLPGFGVLVSILFVRTLLGVSLYEPLFRYYMEFLVLLGIWLTVRFFPLPIFSLRRQIGCAIIAFIALISAGTDPSFWLGQFSKERLVFVQIIDRLQNYSGDHMRSWFPTRAYSVFLQKGAATKHKSPLQVTLPPYPDTGEWVKSVVEAKLDVFVFDPVTMRIMDRILGPARAKSEIKKFTASCYDKLDTSDFISPVEIYLRKQDCRN